MTTAIWSNSLYYVFEDPSWESAEERSVDLGGHLVSITSAYENDFIVNNFFDLGTALNTGDAWIGFTDSESEGTTEGEWIWTSGEEVTFTNWNFTPSFGQEPNGGNAENYGVIHLDYPGRSIGISFWNDRTERVDSPAVLWGIAELSLYLSTNLPAEINEGEDFLLNIDLTAGSTEATYTAGQTIWYQIDGVQESDFTNDVSLSGWGVIAESGNIILDGATKAGIALNLVADSDDEGETLSISFYSANPDLSVYEPENLVVNGDFEADVVVPSNPNWEGDYLIRWTPTGWEKLYGSGVDLLNQYHPKPGGVRGEINTPYGNYVELDGMNNTGIAQNIQTSAGVEYVLSFDWALPSYDGVSYSFPDPYSQFDVVVNGETIFSYDGTYGIRGGWTKENIVFVADSEQTRLEFREVGISNAEGTLLDNVSVTLSHDSYLDMIQIGETVSAEVIDAVDPITGTLGLPGKVNLKSQGKTPFVLYGNEELVFDPEVQDSLINPESLGFGLVPGETLFTAATKKNGTIHASYEDVDGDTYLDFVVKVATPTIASSELAAGEQDVFAFATTNGGQDLLFTAPSTVFF